MEWRQALAGGWPFNVLSRQSASRTGVAGLWKHANTRRRLPQSGKARSCCSRPQKPWTVGWRRGSHGRRWPSPCRRPILGLISICYRLVILSSPFLCAPPRWHRECYCVQIGRARHCRPVPAWFRIEHCLPSSSQRAFKRFELALRSPRGFVSRRRETGPCATPTSIPDQQLSWSHADISSGPCREFS